MQEKIPLPSTFNTARKESNNNKQNDVKRKHCLQIFSRKHWHQIFSARSLGNFLTNVLSLTNKTETNTCTLTCNTQPQIPCTLAVALRAWNRPLSWETYVATRGSAVACVRACAVSACSSMSRWWSRRLSSRSWKGRNIDFSKNSSFGIF